MEKTTPFIAANEGDMSNSLEKVDVKGIAVYKLHIIKIPEVNKIAVIML